jgi:hypothetical protein
MKESTLVQMQRDIKNLTLALNIMLMRIKKLEDEKENDAT